MRFEPIEKQNGQDNSILFYLRSSLIPVFADLIISCCVGSLYYFCDMTSRIGRAVGLLAFGFWAISFVGFSAALVARISTLVFVTRYRLYGQIYGFLPSHRRIEISLTEIKDIEVRATIGTNVFRYAHLILHPYNGKKVKLRYIRNAEELANKILKLQSDLIREQGNEPLKK